MTVPLEEVPANFVPAAAVIRGEQALFGITGFKARAGGIASLVVKSSGLTGEWRWKLLFLSAEEESGIHGVAVKCVDIVRNTGGEGGFLVRN